MRNYNVPRVLIEYARANAPETYRIESAALRDHYRGKLIGICDPRKRYAIGQDYQQHRVAFLIDLAREIAPTGWR
ncbi:hypothetical protein [Sphingomonas sp. IBVSS2]|uniref:hypothetical protein n=1 Tax=Sphingomonas sp. IBVSS2 TaxID=1985172 RepID=UPI0011817952|nr:hypothetical protein [Sphingomonas sp. IBVSS2]